MGQLYSDVDWIRFDTTNSVTMREYYAYQLFKQFEIDAPMQKKNCSSVGGEYEFSMT